MQGGEKADRPFWVAREYGVNPVEVLEWDFPFFCCAADSLIENPPASVTLARWYGYEMSGRADEKHGKHQMWTMLPLPETSFERAYLEAYNDPEAIEMEQQAALRQMILGLSKKSKQKKP